MDTSKDKNWLSPEFVPGLVSVIIPCYNRAFFLEDAIQSLASQTYRPIECIVVDDGSTDNTRAIADKLMESNSEFLRIRYIYQENAGAQAARNTGTIASEGEFIQYLDSDDLLYPGKIKMQVDYLVNNPDADGVFGDWEKGTKETQELVVAYKGDDMVLQLLTEKCIANFSFLMKRSTVNEIGEWDPNIKRNQEIDFQVRGLLKGARYDYQKLVCGLWRVHESERIANTTSAADILYFYSTWECKLKKHSLWSSRIKNNIAHTLFWAATQEFTQPDPNRAKLLMKAIKLNPEISFFNTQKMKVLSALLGKRNALRLWIGWYRMHLA